MDRRCPESASEEELRCRLALWRVPQVGPIHYRRLMAHFGAAREALAASRANLLAQGLPEACTAELASPDWSGVDADLSWLAQDGNHLLQLGETGYPDLLSEIASPPPLLFVRGDVTLLGDPQLAMVGTRNPTPGGRETAHAFAAHLARCGLAITSGLALGIDAESHRGALAAGGRTIAVIGTGSDRIYPARHRQLAHEIAESGAVVSEFPLGTRVLPCNFPRRNRLIAGLSVGTLVTEAAVGSGSLITARLAVDQGREVFAIPGSIHNPMSRGCHMLIRQGAKLVETADDVLEELAAVVRGLLAANEAPESDPEARPDGQPLPEHARLLELMGYDPVSVDTLVERSRLTPAEVSSMLLIMELQGLVAATHGGFYLRNGHASSPDRESPQ